MRAVNQEQADAFLATVPSFGTANVERDALIAEVRKAGGRAVFTVAELQARGFRSKNGRGVGLRSGGENSPIALVRTNQDTGEVLVIVR